MLNMYNHTASGLAISGAVAWLTYSSGLLYSLGSLMWLFVFAPLGMILWYSFTSHSWDIKKLGLFYYAFVTLMGLSLSSIFAIYTAYSITQVLCHAQSNIISKYSTRMYLTSL